MNVRICIVCDAPKPKPDINDLCQNAVAMLQTPTQKQERALVIKT